MLLFLFFFFKIHLEEVAFFNFPASFYDSYFILYLLFFFKVCILYFHFVKIYCIFQSYMSSIKFNLSFNCSIYFHGSYFIVYLSFYCSSLLLVFIFQDTFFNYIFEIICSKFQFFNVSALIAILLLLLLFI